jgi:hypothetical protein
MVTLAACDTGEIPLPEPPKLGTPAPRIQPGKNVRLQVRAAAAREHASTLVIENFEYFAINPIREIVVHGFLATTLVPSGGYTRTEHMVQLHCPPAALPPKQQVEISLEPCVSSRAETASAVILYGFEFVAHEGSAGSRLEPPLTFLRSMK